jgi:hypothetical protein
MPPEGWAALHVLVLMPPPKQFSRFNELSRNQFIYTSLLFNQIWARPLAAMVAETAFIVAGGGQ